MEQVAKFVFALGGIANAMINGQQLDYTECKLSYRDGIFDWARFDRQMFGSRAILAIMEIPSTETYHYPMAAPLVQAPGALAAPILVLMSRPGSSRSPLEWWDQRRKPKTPKPPSGGAS